MSFSAKSLLSKAKEIQELENTKRKAELQAQKEQRKLAAQNKKFNHDFINEIGIRCVEKALENETFCLIKDDELEKYKKLIKTCGLNIEKLKLTTGELEEDYPELYEEFQIEPQLDAILDQLDQLNEDESDFIDDNLHLLDQNLAEYNDQLYEIFESIQDDDWYLTLLEKTIAEEIECCGLSSSDQYSDDAEMYASIHALLELLKKYKEKGVRDAESDMASEATIQIRELIREIPTITKLLKEHKSNISKLQKENNREKEERESQIEHLMNAKDDLLNNEHQVNIISWDTGDTVSSENSFLNPKNLRWIMNNPLMEDLFKFIEKKILNKSKSCEIIFNSYGPRITSDQYLTNGLFFDDFLVELTINEMSDIFECLGYEVHLTSSNPKKGAPSNLLHIHTVKISWPS